MYCFMECSTLGYTPPVFQVYIELLTHYFPPVRETAYTTAFQPFLSWNIISNSSSFPLSILLCFPSIVFYIIMPQWAEPQSIW